MKALLNSNEFMDALFEAIANGKDTYIFGATWGLDKRFDFFVDDDPDIEEYGNYFHITGSYDIIKLQKTLFESLVGDNDEPVDIVFDYVKHEGHDEDHYYMLPRLKISWKEEDDDDENNDD